MASTETKIMLVDDEPVVTKTIAHHLKMAGYSRIRTVNDSSQAIAAIGQFQPRILLLDISMPRIDGMEILEMLSGQVVDNSLTVIMVTSSTEDCQKRQALILGACDFLRKPVDPQKLVARIESALQGRPNLDFILRSLPPRSVAPHKPTSLTSTDPTPPAEV